MSVLSQYEAAPPAAWQPELSLLPAAGFETRIRKEFLGTPAGQDYFFVVDRFLEATVCEALIAMFAKQDLHPVGVDGYVGATAGGEVGSHRANAWSESIAASVSPGLATVLQPDAADEPSLWGFESFRDEGVTKSRLLGSTPFLRFMRYRDGGKHVPHYDAPFQNARLHYITLMSWVLYLNTPDGDGGEFQFVDDRQWNLAPIQRKRDDWHRMATAAEVLASVRPEQGRLLILPHWLPHQVNQFRSPAAGSRIIIRGDVAYGG